MQTTQILDLQKKSPSVEQEKKQIKKVIIIDAGGVFQPDAELGAPNQEKLAKLTHLSEEELNQEQDYRSLNDGKASLLEALKKLSERARCEIKPSVEELLQAYKQGIKLYPGAPEMIRDLYKAGYQVVVLTNNSDKGVQHTRDLLAAEGLACVAVYGSAELHLQKPDSRIFEHVCKAEQVTPKECWFVDDREENRKTAQSLGMSVIAFNRPTKLDQAAQAVNACRDALLKESILIENDFIFPSNFNRGKYPSLFGIVGKKVIRYQPSDQSYVEVDEPNEDGNQKKRCLYESRLAKLILTKEGRPYWESGYQAINELFLADFDLKSDPKRVNDYKAYFDKIGSSLKKEGLIEDKSNYTVQELRAALNKLFVNNFDLTQVSQFYYNVWLFNYGCEVLEPFVFLTDALKEARHFVEHSSLQTSQPIQILKRFPDMAHNSEDRRQAYAIAQSWLTCGSPNQLRGRQSRPKAPKPADAITFGIMRDDDPNAANFSSLPHFAAKVFFSPAREHPIAKEFQANAAPIVGGSSGTLGRNVYMLASLVQCGLLPQADLMRYVMGFVADLIYRGHHSFEEVAFVADQLLFPLKPWVDSLRDPLRFYEQLLTDEFAASDIYEDFLMQHKNFFDEPVAVVQMKLK